ncbi:MAG: hypothetical protein ACI4RT_09490 [Candidatus Spyradenecus sp.]
MRHFLLCLFSLFALSLVAQDLSWRIQTEATLPLSIAQEADEAIERARQWLEAQGAPTNTLPQRLLYRYALADTSRPFTLHRCDLTPLEAAMPDPTPPAALTNLTATLTQYRQDPKALFALQRDLPAASPPPDWREALALALINSQQITPSGGHWGSFPNTLWALLTLRALLNESAPIHLAD